MWGVVHMATEDPFITALRHLQKIHEAKIQELKKELDIQKSLKVAREEDLRKLRATVKRLKAAVSASKLKIRQQADVISEQSIILKNAGCPQPFGLVREAANNPTSNISAPSNQTCVTLFDSPSTQPGESSIGTKPENGRVALIGESVAASSEKMDCSDTGNDTAADITEVEINKESISTHSKSTDCGSVELHSRSNLEERNVLSSPPPSPPAPIHKEGLHHVIYSHAIKSAPGNDQNSTSTGRQLSLKENIGAKVRYKKKAEANHMHHPSKSSPESKVESDDSTSCSNASNPSSPSLLTRGALGVDEEEDPMSCSILGTASTRGKGLEEVEEVEEEEDPMGYSMIGTISHEAERIDLSGVNSAQSYTCSQTSQRRGDKVKQIADRLITKERSSITPEGSTVSGSSDNNIVPVTPGVPLVKDIVSNDRWAIQYGDVRKTNLEPTKKLTGVAAKRSLDVLLNSSSMENGATSETKRLATGLDGVVKHQYKKSAYKLPVDSSGLGIHNSRKRTRPEHLVAGLGTAASRTSASENEDTVRGNKRKDRTTISAEDSVNRDALKVAKRDGLPTKYKCETKILKKADRDKLDAKACPDCKKWFESDDGMTGDQRARLRHVCRHKALHLPPDSDPRMWNISFPNTEECEQIIHPN